MSERGSESYWAHVLWQRHGLRIEEFLGWSGRKQAAYIASEIMESEKPVRLYTLR